MLIRVSGYNSGVKEYLEEGVKNGRDYSRDELDERVVLEGDLNLTDRVYKSITDRGQNRYTTFTLSFREDEIPNHVMQSITKEFREFIMYAYEEEEYNFYAEAHLPKLKEVYDKRTGEKIERKPHIHIVVPKVNLLSGRVNDIIGDHDSTEKYLEAFQEYINQKYTLASPREHVRVNPYNSADVLSRYKGDDFRGKNREFKQSLVKEVIDSDIRTRQGFYSAVSKYGEIRIRNQGKEDEYIAVKLPGDEKFTNLKETIFHDSFIMDRKLAKPPLAKHVISDRLHEWPMRSKEIKYVAKASKSFRNDYYSHSDLNEKIKILGVEQLRFYEKFGGQHELHPSEWSGSYERSSTETRRGQHAGATHSLQGMSRSDVATDRETRGTTGAVFLPGNACVYVEQPAAGGNHRLRSDLYVGGTSGTEADREGTEAVRQRRQGTQEGPGETRERDTGYSEGESQTGTRREGGEGQAGSRTETTTAEGREGTGAGSESREGAPPGREETTEVDTNPSPTRYTADAYPNDRGSIESYRYTGVPELGRSDSNFSIRGGSGPGNKQLGIPVYARNPRKSADVSAVERNSIRLFSEPSNTSTTKRTQVRLIKRLMPKPPKNASYVAACLQRRQEQTELSSPQRSALYRADQKYFETRRAIISDKRLSNRDKTQFLSVLTFERLKAHLLIKQPQGNNQHEDYVMSSENIKSKIKPETKYRNTVSGAEEAERGPQDAKERFRKLSQQLEHDLGERSLREKVRIITAADLYTRKSKLSDNVHYLDNTSHKTLFIDTGKTIAVSKHGLNESAVAVALELAKEKFGSTLTVKGTETFKNTAIEGLC
ncbi:LPD7 domain-containing protein [Symbiopectobacterium purcellii]|uniref:Molybdopterin-guanine dinucleotide biosynthesis protein MobB n=1 Tax=Symbiopectobacterium purcellii TaxID=2871826 RepID=A0ABX9AL04_9ENTR|nr:LPD7 domain-containing protein [Symbiopectobacterium purcellii]QZN95448.1 molybdopterin-guanine dinucleotide biosynthesis protein MobB [Symbiopectobacterium purcellii]